jgi:hypothetical protein
MSVIGVSNNNYCQTNSTQNCQARWQQQKDEFQKLGQDLKSGDLTQAQQDFVALSQNVQGAQPFAASPLGQAFSALGQALKSGDLSGAQQDYSTIVQQLQQTSGQVHHHHHHHHAGGASGAKPADEQQNDPLAQALTSLGNDLQSGSLDAAQQDFSTILRYLQNFDPNAGYDSRGNATPQTPGNNLNLTA